MLNITVPHHTTPLPAKDFLRQYAGISLTLWRKIKNTGNLQINGQSLPAHSQVQPGDILTLSWVEPCTMEPHKLPLTICFEDDYLLIINKPAGMLVHPGIQDSIHTLANGILYYYREKNLPYGFHPVNRLDRNTSGLMVIAKMPHIQHIITKNQLKSVERQYYAIVAGQLSEQSGTIDAPIGRAPDSIIKRMVHPDGQTAITTYQVIASLPGSASLVKIKLLTGRTHQIRVHFSHIGHPLLGDDLYGGTIDLIHRQALHSAQLITTHPIYGSTIDIACPLPADMAKLLNHHDCL